MTICERTISRIRLPSVGWRRQIKILAELPPEAHALRINIPITQRATVFKKGEQKKGLLYFPKYK